MNRFFVGLLLMFFLSGCMPRQMPSPQPNQDVVATLVAATLAGESGGTKEPNQPVETDATPQDGTPMPPLPSPTDTNTPTLTLTPTPTITDTPEAVPGDPVLSLGVPTFKDTFEDDDNFYTYDEAQSSYQIDDGQFILIAKKANSYETWSLSWGDLKNFYLEITGAFGDECGGKDRYGLIFRAPDTSQGYLLSISCDGNYRLSAYDSEDKEYIEIKKWTSSEHINTGPGATNRLGIKAKNTKLTIYINGHEVAEKSNTMFTKGRFGVLVAATDTPGFTAYLSQAVYWKLP